MSFSASDVHVVTRSAFQAVGVKIATSMQTAHEDCSHLWYNNFGPRIPEVFAAYNQNESFGISFVTDMEKGTFDYWAAVALPEGKTPLEGLTQVHVPGGMFLELPVACLDALNDAYTYLCNEWLPGQSEYKGNCSAPCYELYKADFLQTGKIVLYFLVEKA